MNKVNKTLKGSLRGIVEYMASTVGWYLTQHRGKKLIVLMYHRVLPKTDQRYELEEPGMVVTPETLELHMQFLSQSRHPVLKIEEWLALPEIDKPNCAFAVTFDDGWLDNYEYAFPILRRYNIPSTVYLVSDFIGKKTPFWPNKILKILINENEYGAKEYEKLVDLIGFTPNSNLDRDGIADIIKRLKRYSDSQIIDALETVPLDERVPDMINLSQLSDCVKNYGVEIGSHTRTHKRLTENLGADELRQEIEVSREILEGHSLGEISGFCYPNGDYCKAALEYVRQNYEYAVTTKRGFNYAKSFDKHELLRIGVHDDVSNTVTKFKAKLSGWL